MTTPTVAMLVHESLGERVYRSLRDLILSQAYPPGSKLNVEQLCRNLGVSRTPVWDAMRRLETEGLVSTVARQLDAEARAGLEATVQALEAAAGAGDIDGYSRIAIDFHDRILVAARNQ